MLNKYLVYIILIIFIIIFGYIIDKSKSNSNEFDLQREIFIWILIILLTAISGLRKMDALYSDEWIYRNAYLSYGAINDIKNLILDPEPGYALFNWILFQVNSHPQFLILMSSFVINVLITKTIVKYSSNTILSMSLFIFGGFYVSSYNIIRQYIATGILFYAIRYLIANKYIKYLIAILFASSFHATAIILIPISYFIRKKEVWGKFYYKVIIIIGIIYLFFGTSMEILFSFLEETKYEAYYQDAISGSNGVNILRVLVYLIPLVFSFFLKKHITSKKLIYFTNLYLFSCMFMILSTKFLYLSRFDVFFGIYVVFLIPEYIKLVYNNKTRRILYFSFVCLYCLFFAYQTRIGQPYTSFIELYYIK